MSDKGVKGQRRTDREIYIERSGNFRLEFKGISHTTDVGSIPHCIFLMTIILTGADDLISLTRGLTK